MRRAFTLIELMIVIGMLAIIFTFSSINLLSAQHRSLIDSQAVTIATDIRQQQLTAMAGDTKGTGIRTDYGIYLDSTGYTLFRGSTYTPTDSYNYRVNLPDTLIFVDISFNPTQIVFQKGSGEVANYSNTANTFVLKDSSANRTRTFTFNALGVITQMQ